MSQFTKYSYLDPSGPGVLFGAVGEVIRVLDACLVNGYTGKAAAGWTKPFSNSSNMGCYKQNGGAGMTLFVNDNGPNVTSTGKEAWVVGWESMTAVSSPVGTGYGQFPLPGQQLTTGHGVIRKSALADGTTGRTWFVFADATTCYLFINAGDSAGVYNGILLFGDIYTPKSSDLYRCLIASGVAENSTNIGSSINSCDAMASLGTSGGNFPGHYMPRSFGGGGFSTQVFKLGDISKTTFTSVTRPNVWRIAIS
jgi:hypothetical protein